MGRVVRAGVLFVLSLGLFGSGCQGEYPIDPTPCDRWCEARKEMECGYYSPAGCVVSCERQRFTDPECADVFNSALACYEQASIPCDEEDPTFYFPGPYPCSEEEGALYECTYNLCPGCPFF